MKWRHCAVGCAAGGTDCVGWWFLEWVVVMIGGVMLYVFRLCLVLTIITEELVMLCIVHPESIVFFAYQNARAACNGCTCTRTHEAREMYLHDKH